MLKKSLLATVGVLLCSSVAHAADIAPAASDWTGVYVGINGGYGGGTFDYPANFKVSAPPPVTRAADSYILDYDFGANLTASGFFGGVQVGYNWQKDNFVLGVEGDISLSNMKGELELYSDTADASVSGKSEVDWFGTARLRAGYTPTADLLVYLTGGLAWGSVTSSYHADLGSFGTYSDDNTNSHMGWTIGGGFEYAITEHVSLKTEYLYIDLGSQEVMDQDIAELAGSPGGIQADLKINQDIAIQTIKAGINYRF
jgi:outer membrane immunogenic protein